MIMHNTAFCSCMTCAHTTLALIVPCSFGGVLARQEPSGMEAYLVFASVYCQRGTFFAFFRCIDNGMCYSDLTIAMPGLGTSASSRCVLFIFQALPVTKEPVISSTISLPLQWLAFQ